MHELSLCSQIHRIVDRAAAGRPVAVVHLEVGQLRQIVPDTLCYCWTMVAEGTPLAGSTLVVDSVPVTAACRACGHVTAMGNALILVCERCQGLDLEIKTGEEFMIISFDLAEPDDAEV